MTYKAILPEIGTKTTQIKWRKKQKSENIGEFLGNLGIFWELTWDFYKIIVGNAARV